MQLHITLSTSFYDTRYHRVDISHNLVDVDLRAAGKRGTFANHHRSHHSGFLSYMGERSKNAQSQPSPSEGSKHHDQEHGFWYYENSINPVYWPKNLHLFNDFFFSIYCCILPIQTSMLFLQLSSECKGHLFCRLSIATIEFLCSPHCNDKDLLPQQETNAIIEKLQAIKSHKSTTDPNWKDEATKAIECLSSWGTCIPTMCFYQVIRQNHKKTSM